MSQKSEMKTSLKFEPIETDRILGYFVENRELEIN